MPLAIAGLTLVAATLARSAEAATLHTAIAGGLRIGASSGDERASEIHVARSQPGMKKRLFWAALVAVMMATAGLVARRFSATLWRKVMREEPPTEIV